MLTNYNFYLQVQSSVTNAQLICCSLCILTVINAAIAAPAREYAYKTESTELNTMNSAEKEAMIDEIILRNIFKSVEEQSKAVTYTEKQKMWILSKIASYLFDSEEKELTGRAYNKYMHHRHRSGLARRLRRDVDDDFGMDRITHAQEYRILRRLAMLLESGSTSTAKHDELLQLMVSQG